MERTEDLKKYVKFVLDLYDDFSPGYVYRAAMHIAAVKPYGLEERDTWMLFANMEHDFRWCGHDVDRLVDAYDVILQKLSSLRSLDKVICSDGEACDLGQYEKNRYHNMTLRELKLLDFKKEFAKMKRCQKKAAEELADL